MDRTAKLRIATNAFEFSFIVSTWCFMTDPAIRHALQNVKSTLTRHYIMYFLRRLGNPQRPLGLWVPQDAPNSTLKGVHLKLYVLDHKCPMEKTTCKQMMTPQLANSRVSILHVLVVALSMALTFSAWHFSKKQAESRIEQRFESSRDHIVGLLRDRMRKYEDALWAGVAAMESHDGDMTRAQWRTFATHLRIDEKYPGINGIGVIHFLSDQSLNTYLDQRRSEQPDFNIFPPHEHPTYMPISFIEPEEINVAAVGLDVAHELNRRTAALASRDTGDAQITGPIVLVQDAGATPGFLFYAPFYRGGVPTELEDRQSRIDGVVYAPFVVRKLLDGLLAKDLRYTSIRISDAGETIYDEHSSAEELHDPAPMFSEEVKLEFYGRSWSLDIRSNLAFRENNSYVQPTVILVGGIVIEVLILSLLILMARANRNAVAYADKVTKDLRIEQQKLIRSNEELERYAYAASHDLKTPIRGIGGLTEMLKEDLEDYLSAPDANPEIAMSLDLILDRVQRMNDLTNGIIEFSRVGARTEDGGPLDLSELTTSLRSDFGLSPHQIELNSSVRQVNVDPIGLRRVLENLVGNAVRYHDAVDSLKVSITCEETMDGLAFSVADNGPGIDQKYQERIFEMFQTLRTGDAPESTGIGLAVVKKAVEVHGGEVTLISNTGEGAKFSFQWPQGSKSDVAQGDWMAA
ncbi:CHASE domain-containing protein [uncultured Roseobacter sp.]|uniref:CHASE domain-containing protein n=1 Tax=uncultured Roseobacter sp. TaxID=114847 RepID=UPI00261F5538|nr:CHASE domain-containing protein [uncultured Roseobacter sp.]